METLVNKEETVLEKTQIHTCRHCGHKGTDMYLDSVYVGGRGYVFAYYCKDSESCWQRWKEGEAVKSTTENGGGCTARPQEGK